VTQTWDLVSNMVHVEERWRYRCHCWCFSLTSRPIEDPMPVAALSQSVSDYPLVMACKGSLGRRQSAVAEVDRGARRGRRPVNVD
jgi:hypothetical protein